MSSLSQLLATFLACIALARTSPAQTVLLSENFEGGLANWTSTGLWNLESETDVCGALTAPFPSGSQCAYYGIDTQCNYDTGTVPNAGTLSLITPVLIPSGVSTATLQFRQFIVVEVDCDPAYDFVSVQISTNGGASWLGVWAIFCISNGHPEILWHTVTVDLTAFRGQSILVRFAFDTVDTIQNQHLGWMVDDVEVLAEPGSASCGAPCPCGNQVPPVPPSVYGCRNSAGAGGQLSGSGYPLASLDTLALRARGLPANALAILVESLSSASTGVLFGDGSLCLTGSLRRIVAHAATGGTVNYPGPTDPPLSSALLASVPPAGLSVTYQVHYRDIAIHCTPATFNMTNSYRVLWTP